MSTALVILAPGAEEIEVLTIADVLVRGAITVVVASSADIPMVRGSRGIPLAAHTLLDTVAGQQFDLLCLPGGSGGAAICRDDGRIQDRLQAQLASSALTGIICASPIALVPRGLCKGRRVTSYPGVRSRVEPYAATWIDQPVVVDGNLVTSQGPGTAMAFALRLCALVAGSDVATQVAKDMITTAPA